jgi:hypothetical protein
MNVIGDLERLVATSLYPLRVPIAIVLILGIGALLILARRRGWFAASRRHPRRFAAASAIVLVVGLPAAWYLGSPLFIRTTLIEPAPVAIAPLTTTPPTAPAAMPTLSASPTDAPPAPTSLATPGPTPFAARVVAAGSFEGADEFHFGQGMASIIETGPGVFTLRFEAFSVRNGPDLYVYLSSARAGYADDALELGTLKATDGAFGYPLPDGLDPTEFESAVIWCKQFSVQFAVAPLEPA